MDPEAAILVRAECTQIIAAFAHHVDNRLFDAAVALFAPDGAFERPDLTARGRGEIAALWATRPATVHTRHLCHLPWFSEVTPTLARAVTPFTLYNVVFEGKGLPPVPQPAAVAEFHDEFRLTDEGWRIAHRKSRPVFFG